MRAICINLLIRTSGFIDTASVLKRVAKLEKQNDTIKQELFEMEARLLKALSDNKMYVLRKVKEFKVVHGEYIYNTVNRAV